MINKFLFWLTGFLPCRIITINDSPYLERYYITRNIYLHRFISLDGDRNLHDHPWTAMSFILSGCYTEELTEGRHRVRKWFNFIDAGKFHRIMFVEPHTWTLFIRGTQLGPWGFINNKGYYKPVTYTHAVTDHYPIGNKSNREKLNG